MGEVMNWGNWAGHIVMVASTLLVIGVGLTFKFWHKVRRRRAPLSGRSGVGHLPGQQLLKRISHHDEEVGLAINPMLLALPLMFMVWATLHVQWERVRWGGGEWMFVSGFAFTFAWGLFNYIRHYKKREQAQDGWTAEQVTGQQLNRLMAQGCHVLHDLPADVGNIDHVVIAPRGIYAVETKSFRKPKGVTGGWNHPSHQVHYDGKQLRFPDFVNVGALEQAMRQAQWLRRTLRDALGRDVPVIPALAVPGWFVVASEDAKRAEVRVFTPMGRGSEFMTWQPEHIDEAQRRLIASTLAARYPALEE